MIGGFLDMDKFTFDGKVIQSIAEMVMEDTLQGPDLTTIHTIYPDIVSRTELGFIGEGGPVGMADQGCNPNPQSWDIATRKLVWEPHTWEVFLAECYTNLENAATVYSLRTGVDIPDFTDTDYMNIVLEVLEKAMKDFWYRMFWFGDLEAKNVSDGGVITDGVDTGFFTIIDGLWKQILAQAAENEKQRAVTITENEGGSYSDQTLDPANVQEYFSKLVFGAPLQLRQAADRFILVTQAVYDAYEQSLMDGCCLESSRIALLNGVEALKYKGIPVIAMPIWDKLILSYEDTGSKLNNPNRMLFTTKSNLGLGVDNYRRLGQLRVWFDPKDKEVYVRSMGRADAKLINPKSFTLGI